MQNPWVQFVQEFPYLLPSDYQSIIAFNKNVGEAHKIRYELLPEPFLGRPDAEIILLNLNPGYSERDLPFYEQAHVQSLWMSNILHKPLEYPFYLLDPSIADESGSRWWAQKLKSLINLAGRKVVANKVCCIESFPYHSKNFKASKTILESQFYSFYLVKEAVSRRVPVVVMRAERLWFEAVPELSSYPNIFRLNSAQNVSISRNNCPSGFDIIEQALLQDAENQ